LLKEFSALSHSSEDTVTAMISACDALTTRFPEEIVSEIKSHMTASVRPSLERLAEVVLEATADIKQHRHAAKVKQLSLAAI
jgi:hypothetical protein